MSPQRVVKTFTDKYPFVGPAFWISSVQYFIVQVVAARAWDVHFSLRRNLISDLGNTACGSYAGRFVCSPLHALMNASFLLLGLTMIVGSLLVYQEFRETQNSWVGFNLMGLAGFGTLLVGLFPENSIASIHLVGALLPFVIGNLGLILLGWVLELPGLLRAYTIASGVISLVALIFFTAGHYLHLGPGGMERLVAYPQTVWLIVFGLYMSSSHISVLSKRLQR